MPAETPATTCLAARSTFTTSFARMRAAQSDLPSGEIGEASRRRVDFQPVLLALQRDRLLGDEAVPFEAIDEDISSFGAGDVRPRAVRRERRPSHECGRGCLKRSFPEAASSRWSDWSSAPVQRATTRDSSGVSASANGYGETSVCVPVGGQQAPVRKLDLAGRQARRHDAVGVRRGRKKEKERTRICLERKERTGGAYGED